MMVNFSPHIALDVNNRSDAVAFYRGVLGMEPSGTSGDDVVLTCGDVTFYLQEADDPTVYLEFSTTDIDEVLPALRDHGCEIQEIEASTGGTSYMVTDRFGLTFHLFEKM